MGTTNGISLASFVSLSWVLNPSVSFTPLISPSLQRDTPHQEFGSIWKCKNWSMLTTLTRANYCRLPLFITWRRGLLRRCSELWQFLPPVEKHLVLLFPLSEGIIVNSFSHLFLCLVWDLLAFFGFVKEIHRKCLSPGENLGETACLSFQGAVIQRQPQAHQFYNTKNWKRNISMNQWRDSRLQ